MSSPTQRVLHVIAPYSGNSPLRHRQELFLQSIEQACRRNTHLLAVSKDYWQRDGWECCERPRDASIFGEPSDKPFIKDLYDLALERSAPGDWLLYSNIDCSITPDFYQNLLSRSATVVEYQRLDVSGDPQTLEELFANPRSLYAIGVDAVALRADYYSEIRDWLPDFVCGEPHWDTIYSGILRKLIPVQRDCARMLHPKHPQAWDLSKPNAGARHNHELFMETLELGYADKTIITETPDATDTAVVVAVFGNDPARIQASIEGIEGQLNQDLYADLFLVELIIGDAESAYPVDLLSRVNHVPVRTNDGCLDLFQKEALLNYGWRTALGRHPYEYFIFVDADVYAQESAWFRRIRSRLQEDPARAVQGWQTVRDTLDPTLHYSSVGAAYVFDKPTDLPLNPGICWGMHRELLEKGNGFNPYCLDCGGDSAFVAEYLNTEETQYDPWLNQWGWFREVERELPFRAQLDCVPVDLVHVHHGYLKERNYDGFRYAMDALRPLNELIHTNAHGLLEWRDGECVEREILRQRHEMNTRGDVDNLLIRFSYPRFARTQPSENGSPKKSTSSRPVRLSPRKPAARRVHAAGRPSGLKIFDPKQVFRKDFPFSWCDGVVKAEDSTYVPIVDTDEAAMLVLDGKPDAPYVVCALPLQPTWMPNDISQHRALQFAIGAFDPLPTDVFVCMVSQSEDGAEHNSLELSLRERGLQVGCANLSISLDQFACEGFDLRAVRLVKFVSYQTCRLELAKIYVTD